MAAKPGFGVLLDMGHSPRGLANSGERGTAVCNARLTRMAARRPATVAELVPVMMPDGGRFLVRPLVAADREELTAAFARQSQESIQRRFFTAARPGSKMVDHLVDVDYVDHFAWGVLSEDGERVAAEGRYIRRGDSPTVADIAFDVFDEYQGRGLATLLMGALALAASNAGISCFVADVLYENHAMRAVLRKADATWKHDQPGVVTATVDTRVAEWLVEGQYRSELVRVARRVVTAGEYGHARPWQSGQERPATPIQG